MFRLNKEDWMRNRRPAVPWYFSCCQWTCTARIRNHPGADQDSLEVLKKKTRSPWEEVSTKSCLAEEGWENGLSRTLFVCLFVLFLLKIFYLFMRHTGRGRSRSSRGAWYGTWSQNSENWATQTSPNLRVFNLSYNSKRLLNNSLLCEEVRQLGFQSITSYSCDLFMWLYL